MHFSAPGDPHPYRYALVVDDHPLVARGMSEFLRLHKSLDDALNVATAQEALHTVARRGAPALALVDFWLASGSTAHFIRDLLALAPQARVLVVSGDLHPAIALKAQASGAHGFVGKHQDPAVLTQAVATVLDGGLWFADGAGAALRTGPGTDGDAAHHHPREVPVTPTELGLTQRQGQILAHLLEGQPNKQIAAALSLSEHTIKEHVTAILGKLGARNRVEAIARLRGVRLELPL